MTELAVAPAPTDFIREAVAEDLRTGKHTRIKTRFPPEPNGYLHIGHAKSICLNFGIAHEFNGICNVRMDDTNPTKEETEYVDSIMADVYWLIDGWADKNLGGAPLYTSDYFDRLYQFAVELIAKGKAYVDDMTAEETDEFRRLGKASRFRNRPVEENRDLFERMKGGEFPDGTRTLRAKIDVNAPNDWDNPRMLTISGLRRRGVTASALRAFAYNIGITKYPGMTDMAVLDHTIRDEFNRTAERRLVVLHPLKVLLTNYPEGKVEELEAVNNPEDENAGRRKVPFSRELFIDAADFMETPPPKYFRLKPGGEVRLKYAYIIKCDEVVKDSAGNVTELRCTVDLDSKSGGATSNRKVKGTIHWVSAARANDAEVRLYDRLFISAEPDASGDFKSFINPHSLEVVTAKCEPALADATPEKRYQFERLGYFTLDPDSTAMKQVWNRTVTLKDTWAKESKRS